MRKHIQYMYNNGPQHFVDPKAAQQQEFNQQRKRSQMQLCRSEVFFLHKIDDLEIW